MIDNLNKNIKRDQNFKVQKKTQMSFKIKKINHTKGVWCKLQGLYKVGQPGMSLHLQIMGYFFHPNIVCEVPPQHTEARKEGKKEFFWPFFFLSPVLQKN